MTVVANEIVGRGARDGARLFREWFDTLTHAAQNKEQTAYVFVMGSLNEILKTFDLPGVFPEINSLQTAVRRVAHEYLEEAEDYGHSPDICAYVKADVAVQLRGGEHPMGRIPKPTLAVLTNACNTYIKWAEIWERMYGIPTFVLDVPGTRAAGTQTWPGHPDFENDRRYVAAQIRELIPVLAPLESAPMARSGAVAVTITRCDRTTLARLHTRADTLEGLDFQTATAVGLGKAELLAQGIYEALVTTATGLTTHTVDGLVEGMKYEWRTVYTDSFGNDTFSNAA